MFQCDCFLCGIAEKNIELFLLNFSCNTSCKAQVFTSCKTLDLQVIIPVKLMSHHVTRDLQLTIQFHLPHISMLFFSFEKSVLVASNNSKRSSCEFKNLSPALSLQCQLLVSSWQLFVSFHFMTLNLVKDASMMLIFPS